MGRGTGRGSPRGPPGNEPGVEEAGETSVGEKALQDEVGEAPTVQQMSCCFPGLSYCFPTGQLCERCSVMCRNRIPASASGVEGSHVNRLRKAAKHQGQARDRALRVSKSVSQGSSELDPHVKPDAQRGDITPKKCNRRAEQGHVKSSCPRTEQEIRTTSGPMSGIFSAKRGEEVEPQQDGTGEARAASGRERSTPIQDRHDRSTSGQDLSAPKSSAE